MNLLLIIEYIKGLRNNQADLCRNDWYCFLTNHIPECTHEGESSMAASPPWLGTLTAFSRPHHQNLTKEYQREIPSSREQHNRQVDSVVYRSNCNSGYYPDIPRAFLEVSVKHVFFAWLASSARARERQERDRESVKIPKTSDA